MSTITIGDRFKRDYKAPRDGKRGEERATGERILDIRHDTIEVYAIIRFGDVRYVRYRAVDVFAFDASAKPGPPGTVALDEAIERIGRNEWRRAS